MIQLSHDADSLVLVPEQGGAVLGWTRRGVPMLRRPSPDAVLLGRPAAMGCFPQIPFCNRIANRRFHWAGYTHELAANFGDSPHAIHGVGWRRSWRLEEISANAAVLSLRHDATGDAALAWPFAFAARMAYRLDAHGLTIRMEATNLHHAPAPMGLGAHPWFPRTPGAAIAFQADGVWFTRDALPITHGPIPEEWDHANGRPVDREPLDNCFTGWHGVARIPGMRIEADPIFANLQVYTPTGADFFCVEPNSHIADAINRPGLPATQAMTVLEPGATLSGSMRFTPDDAPRP
jgi:aldose 1-epimerase